MFVYFKGPDGAGDDWSLSQPSYFVLPQVCYKFPGERNICDLENVVSEVFVKLC